MSADGNWEFSSGPTPEQLSKYASNDFGNAMRLILLAGGQIDDAGNVDCASSTLLYVIGRGWIGYDGKRFDFTRGEDLARKLAHRVASQVRLLYPFWVAGDGRFSAKEFAAYANLCGSAGSTSAMLRQAQSYLTVDLEAFDRDPLALNTQNGTVRMRWSEKAGFRVRLDPHDPADRITKITAAKYDPDAQADRFRKVVADSLPDLEWREYLHRCLGYCATGLATEQAFFVAQGRGRDGKSTILDAVREAMGDFAEVGDVASFLESVNRGSGGPSPELVKLSGDVRLAVMSEPHRGQALAEGRLKAWTSGSPITARDLNAKNFNFRPIAKLFWEMNTWAPVKDDSDGIWRRIHTLLFKNQVPLDKLDRELPAEIRAHELDGVLAWLIEGVGLWLTPVEVNGQKVKGLRPPRQAEEAKADYRRAASPFGDWLEECCVTHANDADGRPFRTLSKDLYQSFKDWSEAQGTEKIQSIRSFGDALRARQIDVMGKNNAGQKFRGPIRLKTAEELAADRAAADAAAFADLSGPGAGGSMGGHDFEESPFDD